MRYVIFAFMCIFAVMLDCAFFPALDVWGLTPDVMLFVVVSFSLLQPAQIGLYFAVAAGIMKSLYAGIPMGISLVFYLSASVFTSFLKRRVSTDNVLLPAILVFLLFIVRELLFNAYKFFINNSFNFIEMFTLTTLTRALFTAILALVLYWPVHKLNKRHFMSSIHDKELF